VIWFKVIPDKMNYLADSFFLELRESEKLIA
jgi:hypothetical protein